jgi:cob(I)alamin adenosyltransferase
MIIVNTGNGKGKTTAAIGQIVRSLGRGWKVCLIQLFKGKEFYGEQKVLKGLKGLEFFSFAPKHPGCFKGLSIPALKKDCARALKKFESALKSGKKYDLIVLDEFNIACRDGLLDVKALLEVIKKIDSKTCVLITGRQADQRLIKMADLVTEMKEVKHPYKKGILARKGLEF